MGRLAIAFAALVAAGTNPALAQDTVGERIQRAESRAALYEAQNAALRRSVATQAASILRLEQSLAEERARQAEAGSRHDEQAAALRQAHQAELEALRQAHRAELETQRELQEVRLDRLRRRNEAGVQALSDTILEQEKALRAAWKTTANRQTQDDMASAGQESSPGGCAPEKPGAAEEPATKSATSL